MVHIEMDEAVHRHKYRLSVTIRERSDFDQTAFNGDFRSAQQAGGRDEWNSFE
jgi:hypothetical protein